MLFTFDRKLICASAPVLLRLEIQYFIIGYDIVWKFNGILFMQSAIAAVRILLHVRVSNAAVQLVYMYMGAACICVYNVLDNID